MNLNVRRQAPALRKIHGLVLHALVSLAMTSLSERLNIASLVACHKKTDGVHRAALRRPMRLADGPRD